MSIRHPFLGEVVLFKPFIMVIYFISNTHSIILIFL